MYLLSTLFHYVKYHNTYITVKSLLIYIFLVQMRKLEETSAGYLKVKLDLLKRWHPKYARKRIQHAFVDRIDKSVPWVTVWHHSAEPCTGISQTEKLGFGRMFFLRAESKTQGFFPVRRPKIMLHYVWSVVYWSVSGNLADYLLHGLNTPGVILHKLNGHTCVICQTCQAVLLFQSVCN